MSDIHFDPRPPTELEPLGVDRALGPLRAAILHHCIKFSQSVTKDGRLLDWCVDLREILYRPGPLKAAAGLLWGRIRHLNPDFIGGMTLSAEQLVCGMLRAALDDGRELGGFSKRRAAKTYGLRRRVEGVQPTPNSRVVIVDDLFDSGQTVASVASEMKRLHAHVVGAAAVVDFQNPSFDSTHPRVSLFSLNDLGIRVHGTATIRGPRWVFRPVNVGSYTAPHSTPLIDSSGIVVAGDTGYVVALDHAGNEVWRVGIRDHEKGVRTALVGFEDSIFFCGFDGLAYSVDRHSGETLWSLRLGNMIGASPAVDIDKGIAYLAVNGRTPSSEYVAINLSGGAVLWRRRADEYSYARPALSGEDSVVVAANNGIVQSLARKNGEPRWEVRLPAQVKGWITSEGQRCFLGCFDGNLYALDTMTGRILWRKMLADWLLVHPMVYGAQVIVSAARHLCSLFQEDGSIKWIAPTGGRVAGVGIDPDRNICFAGSDSGLFVCLDLSSGSRHWQYQANGAFRVTPAVSASLCAAPSYDGSLYVFTTEDTTARAG